METLLDSPEKAAAFVVENIAGLTFEQIADIEKSIRKFRPGERIAGLIIEDVTVTVIYGARVLKAIEKMKDLKKMGDRWSLAWCGDDDGRRSGINSHGNSEWIAYCKYFWNPFVLTHINRAIAAGSKPAMPEALSLFYPEIEP